MQQRKECLLVQSKEFPYLHVKGESYEAFRLECKLAEQTDALKVAFADLREDTFRNLSELGQFSDVRRHFKRLVDIADCHLDTFEELEDALCQNYCSWFNYDILKEIRKKFLFPGGKSDEALQTYEEKCSGYCRRRCFESPQSFHPKPVSTNLKSLVFKIDESFDKFTLEQVRKITTLVTNVINCPNYAVYVRSVKEGCVEVSCNILSHAAVNHLDHNQISQLRQNSIVSFKIEDEELMKEERPTMSSLDMPPKEPMWLRLPRLYGSEDKKIISYITEHCSRCRSFHESNLHISSSQCEEQLCVRIYWYYRHYWLKHKLNTEASSASGCDSCLKLHHWMTEHSSECLKQHSHCYLSLCQQMKQNWHLSRADHNLISKPESRSHHVTSTQRPNSLPGLMQQYYSSDLPHAVPEYPYQHDNTPTHNMLNQKLSNSFGYSNIPVLDEQRSLQPFRTWAKYRQIRKARLSHRHCQSYTNLQAQQSNFGSSTLMRDDYCTVNTPDMDRVHVHACTAATSTSSNQIAVPTESLTLIWRQDSSTKNIGCPQSKKSGISGTPSPAPPFFQRGRYNLQMQQMRRRVDDVPEKFLRELFKIKYMYKRRQAMHQGAPDIFNEERQQQKIPDSSADKRYELLDSLIDSEGYDASSEDEADDVISNTSKKVSEKTQQCFDAAIMDDEVPLRNRSASFWRIGGSSKTHSHSLAALLEEDSPLVRESTSCAKKPVRAVGHCKAGMSNDHFVQINDSVVKVAASQREETCVRLTMKRQYMGRMQAGSKKSDLNKDLLDIDDTGGQPMFLDVLPAFIMFGMLTVKLDKSLDSFPPVEYYINEVRIGDSPFTQCHLDTLHHCMRVIRSTHDHGTYPKIVFVSTHKDFEHKFQQESRKMELNRLQSIILAINVKTPEKEELHKVKPVEIPLRCSPLEMVFQQMAKEQQNSVLSKEECFEVAKGVCPTIYETILVGIRKALNSGHQNIPLHPATISENGELLTCTTHCGFIGSEVTVQHRLWLRSSAVPPSPKNTESSSSPSVTTRHFRRDQSDVSGQDKIVFGGGESCTRSNSLTQDQYNSIVKFQEQRGILLTWKKVLLKQRKQAVVTKRCLRQGTLSNDVQSDLDAESSTSSGFVPQKCNFADMIRLYYSQRANVQNTKVVVKRCLLKAKWRKQTQDCNDSCTSDIQCMSSLTSSGFNELERDLTDRKDEKKVVQKDSKMTVEEQVQMIQVGKMSLPPNFPGIHHSKSRTKKQHFSHTMLSPPPRAKMNSTYTPSNHLFHSLPQGTRDTTLTSTNTSPSNVPDSQSSHTYHIQGQVRRELSVSSPMDTSQSNIQRNTGCHIQSEEIQSLKSDICDRLSLTLPLFQPGRCKLASHQVQQMCQRVDYIIPDNSDDKCYDSLTGSEGYDVSSEDEADDFSSNTSEEGNFQFKSQHFGYSSHGAIYKAKLGQLPCAAKVLHATILDPTDPGTGKIMERFQRECAFLESIQHQNVVQYGYLGMTRDPASRLPVLLMELLDKNLTNLFERSQQSLAFYVQMNVRHDIALAVAYLHSDDIIHRDLSGNDVLMYVGTRAKVTDFGMAKLVCTSPSMIPLTTCPGTLAYMPPEALMELPSFKENIDIFSMGMLTMFTRQWPEWPDPGPQTQNLMIQGLKSLTGLLEMSVPEKHGRRVLSFEELQQQISSEVWSYPNLLAVLTAVAPSCSILSKIHSTNSQTGNHLYLLRVFRNDEENNSKLLSSSYL